jgi:hypothetical protein
MSELPVEWKIHRPMNAKPLQAALAEVEAYRESWQVISGKKSKQYE